MKQDPVEECFCGSVTVGERGQVVIPAEARKRLDIQPGDKLLVAIHPTGKGLAFFPMDAIREHLSSLLDALTSVEQQPEVALETEESKNGH